MAYDGRLDDPLDAELGSAEPRLCGCGEELGPYARECSDCALHGSAASDWPECFDPFDGAEYEFDFLEGE